MNDTVFSRLLKFDLNLKEALLFLFLPAFLLLELIIAITFHVTGAVDIGTFLKMQLIFIGPPLVVAGLIGAALYLWLPRGIRVICMRELSSFFNSAIAYVCVVVFALVAGGLAFTLGRLIEYQDASLTWSFFVYHPLIFLVIGPAIGMRLWSEEHRQGTIELLSTMPIATWHAIVGKFLASCVVIFVMLFCTWPAVVTMEILGDPDWGPMWSGYLGSFLIGITSLGITSVVSAFTRSQVVAFLVSMIICLVFVMMGWPAIAGLAGVFPGFDTLFTNLSFWDHFDEMKKGLVTVFSLSYFLILTAFCLIATAVVLRARSRAALLELVLTNIAILLVALEIYFLVFGIWIGAIILLLPLIGLGYFLFYRLTQGGQSAQDGVVSGLGLTLVAAIGIVVYLGMTFIPLRFDFTQHNIYTLSDGTRSIVKGLEAPVKIRYFVTEGSDAMSPQERQFAQKVEDLLNEYAKISTNVEFEKVDTQIDSSEEETARAVGLSAQQGEEDQIYFGIAISALENEEVIAFANPAMEDSSGREQRLEYEISSAITRVYEPKYTLSLVETASTEELPTKGKAQVVVGKIGDKLHFRVFDTKGRKVAERSEDDLPIANLSYVGEIKRILGETFPAADELMATEREDLIGMTNAAIGHVPGKPNVTVMTSMPIGGGGAGMGGFQGGGSPPWFLYMQMDNDFNLTMISTSPSEPIDPNQSDVLIVLHPYDITEAGEFAIDQYVLGGGTVIAVVDPLFASAEAMAPPQQQQFPGMPPQGGGPGPSSELPTLFGKWGIDYSPSQVVADRTYQTQIQTGQKMPTFLSLSGDAMNRESVVTTQLTDMNMLFAGGFRFNAQKNPSIKVEALLTSSKDNQLVGTFEAQTPAQIDSIQENFSPSGTPFFFAVQMTGDSFETAFPAGDPSTAPALSDDPAAIGDTDAPEGSDDSLKRSTKGQPGTVVLVADCDFIFDQWAISRDFRPINHNLSFFQNLTEHLMGNSDLISIRGRSSSSRPFTLLNKMEADARDKTNEQVAEFQKKLEEIQTQIEEYVAVRSEAGDQMIVVSEDNVSGLKDLRGQRAEAERKIRETRKQLRQDIETKIAWIKAMNIIPMALLITIIGLLCWLARIIRTAAR
ncbi:MAG: ABC-2 type transport system permease protein [Verrucomicrobiales bacterium]|jgi:ABC-2 type transport system permease protein